MVLDFNCEKLKYFNATIIIMTDILSPIQGRIGQKIIDYDLEDMLITLLAQRHSIADMCAALNVELQEDSKDAIRNKNSRRANKLFVHERDIRNYVKRRGSEMQEAIKDERNIILRERIEAWEAQSLSVRNDVMETLDRLVGPELKNMKKTVTVIDKKSKETYSVELELSTKDKMQIADILMKKVQVQESGEKFLGLAKSIESKAHVKIDINVSFVDKLKDKIKKRKIKDAELKDKLKNSKIVTAKYQDVS